MEKQLFPEIDVLYQMLLTVTKDNNSFLTLDNMQCYMLLKDLEKLDRYILEKNIKE